MKKLVLVFAVSLCLTASLKAQVVINEVMYHSGDMIELKNLGSAPVDVSTWWTCSFPTYNQISSLTVVSGSTTIPAGGLLVLSGHDMIDNGELGLYTTNTFTSSAAIVDYIEWGSTPHQRSPVAVAAGVWITGQFIPNVPMGSSIEYDGSGDLVADYKVQSTPTFGAENSNVPSIGVEELAIDEYANIYPNPAQDVLTIEMVKTLADVSISIVDIQGRTIHAQALTQLTNSIDVSAMVKGTYFVLYLDTTNKVIGTQKFVKN